MCFEIIVVQENIYSFFLRYLFIFALNFTFYVIIFYTCLSLIYSHHQGFSNRDTIIDYVNMYLVKTN